LILAVAVCAVVTWAIPGLAEDIWPPYWRGEWSTTSQVWEFRTPDNPVAPDGPATGGQPPLPSTMLHVFPGPGMEWIPFDPDAPERMGIWPLSGVMDVVVDNHDPHPENEKWLSMQLTWKPQEVGREPEVRLTYPDGLPIQLSADGNFGFPGEWWMTQYTYKLPVNPPEEFITISGLINVDELVIDTWCVPEPATLCLLALGGLAIMRKTRR
jgi:hypothetical protein